jgi:hypothetical protein
VPIFFFAIIGTLAMWLRRERWRDLSLLLAIIFSAAIGYSPFYAQMRYRIPIEPYIVILSAYGLTKTWLVLASRLACGKSKVEARKQVQVEVKAAG